MEETITVELQKKDILLVHFLLKKLNEHWNPELEQEVNALGATKEYIDNALNLGEQFIAQL